MNDDSLFSNPLLDPGHLDDLADLHEAAALIEAVAPLPGFITFHDSGSQPGDTSERDLAVARWFAFLQSAKYWREHQDDWLAAYSFIESHPALWHRDGGQGSPGEWLMSSGISLVWSSPSRTISGEAVVMMEVGPAVFPACTRTWRDPRMDVWAPTFEEAYRQTAVQLHRCHNLDGSDRGNPEPRTE